MKPKYQHIDHTADVGLIINASSLDELFAYAAEGMFDFITELGSVEPSMTRSIDVNAVDREALLVPWLSELNYLLQTEDILFRNFKIVEISDTRLRGIAKGQQFDPELVDIFFEVLPSIQSISARFAESEGNGGDDDPDLPSLT